MDDFVERYTAPPPPARPNHRRRWISDPINPHWAYVFIGFQTLEEEMENSRVIADRVFELIGEVDPTWLEPPTNGNYWGEPRWNREYETWAPPQTHRLARTPLQQLQQYWVWSLYMKELRKSPPSINREIAKRDRDYGVYLNNLVRGRVLSNGCI